MFLPRPGIVGWSKPRPHSNPEHWVSNREANYQCPCNAIKKTHLLHCAVLCYLNGCCFLLGVVLNLLLKAWQGYERDKHVQQFPLENPETQQYEGSELGFTQNACPRRLSNNRTGCCIPPAVRWAIISQPLLIQPRLHTKQLTSGNSGRDRKIDTGGHPLPLSLDIICLTHRSFTQPWYWQLGVDYVGLCGQKTPQGICHVRSLSFSMQHNSKNLFSSESYVISEWCRNDLYLKNINKKWKKKKRRP